MSDSPSSMLPCVDLRITRMRIVAARSLEARRAVHYDLSTNLPGVEFLTDRFATLIECVEERTINWRQTFALAGLRYEDYESRGNQAVFTDDRHDFVFERSCIADPTLPRIRRFTRNLEDCGALQGNVLTCRKLNPRLNAICVGQVEQRLTPSPATWRRLPAPQGQCLHDLPSLEPLLLDLSSSNRATLEGSWSPYDFYNLYRLDLGTTARP